MPINWADMRKWLDTRFNGRAAHLESAKRAVLQITTTPLSKDIQSYKLPQGFSLPHFQKYDGRMDPVAHLKDFQQALILQEGDHLLYCRTFASSLGRTALN